VNPLIKELRHNPMLWLLVLVPVALVAAKLVPTAHTLLFVLSELAIVPLAALLSHATESVAEKAKPRQHLDRRLRSAGEIGRS
jgi:Ca2+:H+ antiporter